jgi:hypothetical protein
MNKQKSLEFETKIQGILRVEELLDLILLIILEHFLFEIFNTFASRVELNGHRQRVRQNKIWLKLYRGGP